MVIGAGKKQKEEAEKKTKKKKEEKNKKRRDQARSIGGDEESSRHEFYSPSQSTTRSAGTAYGAYSTIVGANSWSCNPALDTTTGVDYAGDEGDGRDFGGDDGGDTGTGIFSGDSGILGGDGHNGGDYDGNGGNYGGDLVETMGATVEKMEEGIPGLLGGKSFWQPASWNSDSYSNSECSRPS